jgi:hypothetical protein
MLHDGLRFGKITAHRAAERCWEAEMVLGGEEGRGWRVSGSRSRLSLEERGHVETWPFVDVWVSLAEPRRQFRGSLELDVREAAVDRLGLSAPGGLTVDLGIRHAWVEGEGAFRHWANEIFVLGIRDARDSDLAFRSARLVTLQAGLSRRILGIEAEWTWSLAAPYRVEEAGSADPVPGSDPSGGSDGVGSGGRAGVGYHRITLSRPLG